MARTARRDRDNGIATITLRDGARIALRQVARRDKPRLVDVFNGMSERSRHRRFFTSIRELSPATLAYFTEIDHSDREAVIAIDPRSGHALGVATLAPGAARSAEVVRI